MNIAVAIIVALSAWKWGDWKNWQKYHTTMLLAMAGNLLFQLIYCNHLLWTIQPDITNHTVVEILYSTFIFPFTVFMFLSNYPVPFKNQILHILKYISVYTLFEFIFSITGRIIYAYGWNLWWSLGWNFIMFSIWALHHKRPLRAYIAAIIIITLMLLLFPIT